MRYSQQLAILQKVGFPLRDSAGHKQIHEVVRDFQRGFAFWNLLADGYVGPKTERALGYCIRHGGRCSPNFTFKEFESHGNTDYTIKVRRELVRGLEELRDIVGPIGILSGYRDPQHNAAVGGASNSQHLYGNAIDPRKRLVLGTVRSVQRFSGIGLEFADHKAGRPSVRHLDVRHKGPNTTGGTVANPTVWFY